MGDKVAEDRNGLIFHVYLELKQKPFFNKVDCVKNKRLLLK